MTLYLLHLWFNLLMGSSGQCPPGFFYAPLHKMEKVVRGSAMFDQIREENPDVEPHYVIYPLAAEYLH